jgi:hypothetical protein
MPGIRGSVGRGGQNQSDDVRTVQQLLNQRRTPPAQQLTVNGTADDATITAIEDFQRQTVHLSHPDGRVDPNGATLRALNAGASNLSGAAWWHANQARYPNSTQVSDLAPAFRTKVQAFLDALDAAGADYDIAATRRSADRAWLMHYSWAIAHGEVNPGSVQPRAGVDIQWDHGDLQRSRQAARDMVNLFGMAHQAALTSRHIEGRAIDMNITWSGTLRIQNKKGDPIDCTLPHNGAQNTRLHQVGASYGVHKLLSDPPHWSEDGA